MKGSMSRALRARALRAVPRDRDLSCFGDYKGRLLALRRRLPTGGVAGAKAKETMRRVESLLARAEEAWDTPTRRWLEQWLVQEVRR